MLDKARHQQYGTQIVSLCTNPCNLSPLQALRKTGLLTSDPRLRDCVHQLRKSTRDSVGPVMMDKTLFRRWERLCLFMEAYHSSNDSVQPLHSGQHADSLLLSLLHNQFYLMLIVMFQTELCLFYVQISLWKIKMNLRMFPKNARGKGCKVKIRLWVFL